MATAASKRGPVVREEWLVQRAAGRRVTHVGFVDYPLLESKVHSGDWLHARLADVATSIVGIDVDLQGVEWADRLGFEAYAVDASSRREIERLGVAPADLVIAGEVIEHIQAPGHLLDAMHTLCKPDGRLIVTTPDAYRLLNFLVPLTRRELVHPDHVAWHSPSTLRRLLETNRWRVETFVYYQNRPEAIPHDQGLIRRINGIAANSARALAANSRWPYWCDGMIATCVASSSGERYPGA